MVSNQRCIGHHKKPQNGLMSCCVLSLSSVLCFSSLHKTDSVAVSGDGKQA